MASLCVYLLGPMRVTLDGKAITHFETEKTRALLAFLAAGADRPHRRDVLAEMLWPERREGAAVANLRHCLAGLRRIIGDTSSSPDAGLQAVPPFLLTTRQTIQFNDAADVYVDTAAFGALLHTPQSTGRPSITALEEAVTLCRGQFLTDISISDSTAFCEWMLITREQLGREALSALHRLATCYEQLGQWKQALQVARRQVELEPWDEQGQRQVMKLLTLNGQRNAALAQYEACRISLRDELDVEPEAETVQLMQRIRNGNLERPPTTAERLPDLKPASAALASPVPADADGAEPPVFVTRERELETLSTFLDQAVKGIGRVVFVTGGAGQGKTALLGEFVRRALNAHPDLLVARGDCNAYAGVGDPYLPFREMMAMLTGDVRARRPAGWVGRDGVRRLWDALPMAISALLAYGPSLIGTILTGDALLSRVAGALPGRTDWLDRIRALTVRARTGGVDLEQSFLFEQITDVLCMLASQRPLALILDDIQWADSGSLGLLFHLGRQLAGAGHRILIACAYRPEELAPMPPGERHPLEKLVHEFRRIFGDVWVDLDVAEREQGRSFVDALLDTIPNHLGEHFRAALYRRTAGHPLFTVELLRAMQERGDLVRIPAADGAWIEGPALNWERLPARVEAVIQERIDRLAPELQEIVSAASVEGETFTAQVVAAMLGRSGRSALRDIRALEDRHHLVRVRSERQTGTNRALRYQFTHILVQEYVYRRLSLGERRLLHGQVAEALEELYERQCDQIAVQLAHHYYSAADYDRAFHYSVQAAENASRAYDNESAITLTTQAIELAQSVSLDVVSRATLYGRRGLAYETLGKFDAARADYEAGLRLGQAAGEGRVEWRALLDLAKLWTTRDYRRSRGLIDEALDLAHRMGDPAIVAGSLNWAGNWALNAEDLPTASGYHLQALEIFEQLGDRAGVAHTLDDLGLTSQLRGELSAGIRHYDRAIALLRELGDLPGLANSLTSRGVAGTGAFAAPTLVSPIQPIDAHHDLDEALQIAREIDAPAAESWALWCLALLHAGNGQFGPAMDAARNGLDLASAIGHREWMAGGMSVLGALYVELLAPEQALPHLQQALALAEQLQSRHWIHYATGKLAAACCLLNETAQARSCLDTVISPQTAMDTVHKRTCWLQRAELALLEGEHHLALEIVDRLIASAPGMSPGRVITVLWKLKGEALAAAGHHEEALSHLRAAVENAQVAEERYLLWRLHGSLGRLYGTMQRPSEAEAEVSTARDCVQELASSLTDEGLRANFVQRALNALEPLP